TFARRSVRCAKNVRLTTSAAGPKKRRLWGRAAKIALTAEKDATRRLAILPTPSNCGRPDRLGNMPAERANALLTYACRPNTSPSAAPYCLRGTDLPHQNIAELPRVFRIDVFRKQ